MILFNKAKKGANGKATTNKVIKPNWITVHVKNCKSNDYINQSILLYHAFPYILYLLTHFKILKK